MSAEYKGTISAIEITFAEPVEVTRAQQILLQDIVSDVCKAYCAAHPDRVMWLFGFGSKLTANPMWISDDEPLPFDDSILSLECAERERYDTERAKGGAA